MRTTTYTEPAFEVIISGIGWYSEKLRLPIETFQLGAEAYQEQIYHYPYPELVRDILNQNHEMTGWYWRKNDNSKGSPLRQKQLKHSNIS